MDERPLPLEVVDFLRKMENDDVFAILKVAYAYEFVMQRTL